MNKTDVRNIITAGESEKVEFKSSFQKEVIEIVVAFANAHGDKILIGVKNDKIILGLKIEGEVVQQWLNEI